MKLRVIALKVELDEFSSLLKCCPALEELCVGSLEAEGDCRDKLVVASRSLKKLEVVQICLSSQLHVEVRAPNLRELCLKSTFRTTVESIHLEEHQLEKVAVSTHGTKLTYKDASLLENIHQLVVCVKPKFAIDWEAIFAKTINCFPSLSSLSFQAQENLEDWCRQEPEPVSIERFCTADFSRLKSLTLEAIMLRVLKASPAPFCRFQEPRFPSLVTLECGFPHTMTKDCFDTLYWLLGNAPSLRSLVLRGKKDMISKAPLSAILMIQRQRPGITVSIE